MARDLGGAVERTGASEFGKAELEASESELFHDLPPEQTVWMSHRDSVTAPPEGAEVTASLAVDADRGVRGPGAPPLRRPVPSRGRAHAARAGDPEELPVRGRRRAADLDAGGGDRGAGRANPRGGRRRARAVRALGRRRLGGRGASRAQGGRRPAHLRLRRPRPAARERGRAGGRDVLGPLPRAARPRAGAEALPLPARGRLRPRGEAQDRRRGVHPSLRGGGAQARRRPLPRPGDALLGRHRVGRRRTTASPR